MLFKSLWFVFIVTVLVVSIIAAPNNYSKWFLLSLENISDRFFRKNCVRTELRGRREGIARSQAARTALEERNQNFGAIHDCT
ncbi:hypothetical protein CC86DRAFT_165937 [Ophiobolus disseminans]|uniref:Uncharacterized protein n=1 Tax=Ophiobolus disseminans TaxID=1469910 RepID=A0A6A7ACT6_9PLEO|nr:hypothetical protein CC86DRAFT_165937 [Ophiobolus disseminans]